MPLSSQSSPSLTRRTALFTTVATSLGLWGGGALALEDLKVVTTIKPVHSLVAAVMEGVGTPSLLIDGAASPHGFALKPSQAADLQNADLVIWVGPQLAPALEKPIETLAANAVQIELMKAPGVHLLGYREGARFEGHSHDHGEEAHGHDDHDHGKEEHASHDHGHDHAEHDRSHDDHSHDDHSHDHASHDDHGHDKEEHAGHDQGHNHAHGGKDSHIWLDPENGKAMVNAIEAALIEADPEHADAYKANAANTRQKIDNLSASISGRMATLNNTGFIVFHDAYRYFEHRFDIEAAGAISISPDTPPSADRIRQIRDLISESSAACVFIEPQFEPKIVDSVIEGTQTKAVLLDPLGAMVENGPDLYTTVIEGVASSLEECFSQG
ncbi:zinc ABC transporter substrate-binding protein [Roseibium aquae]|uniref:High-affinity zinc uptake system protein ZnuA n=1 Tax=Roseibium aquae TaxID=1323746 RepID=A0A916TLY4_9HYPH|nr:zinc ABC transporter substrate-binding protein [Roseibium aquae]GGB54078.1 zinc ABC transporter substrate-binding protein [Roseibium aquae]